MNSRRSLCTAAFVLVAGFAVVACASSDSADVATTAAPVATGPAADAGESTAQPGVVGDAPEIMQFTSTLVGGGELDVAELSDKPTAFWFWSPT